MSSSIVFLIFWSKGQVLERDIGLWLHPRGSAGRPLEGSQTPVPSNKVSTQDFVASSLQIVQDHQYLKVFPNIRFQRRPKNTFLLVPFWTWLGSQPKDECNLKSSWDLSMLRQEPLVFTILSTATLLEFWVLFHTLSTPHFCHYQIAQSDVLTWSHENSCLLLVEVANKFSIQHDSVIPFTSLWFMNCRLQVSMNTVLIIRLCWAVLCCQRMPKIHAAYCSLNSHKMTILYFV